MGEKFPVLVVSRGRVSRGLDRKFESGRTSIYVGSRGMSRDRNSLVFDKLLYQDSWFVIRTTSVGVYLFNHCREVVLHSLFYQITIGIH